MDLGHFHIATVLVLSVVHLGAQLLSYMRLLRKKVAYKTMFLSWVACLGVCLVIQLWLGVGITAPFAVVTGVLWWRHRDDDDDDSGRRRRRVASRLRSKLPRPVAVARPTPTES
ncbi:hypothetical protein ACWEWX_32910 [Streptomyces asiaticus]